MHTFLRAQGSKEVTVEIVPVDGTVEPSLKERVR